MGFRPFIRKAAIGFLAAAAFFVATNATGVASANPEQCSVWQPVGAGERVQVCITVSGHTVSGRVNLYGLKPSNKMGILINRADNSHGYASGLGTTISRSNLPPDTYRIFFFAKELVPANTSPPATIP